MVTVEALFPESFWDEEAGRLLAILLPEIERVVLAGVEAAEAEMAPLGFAFEIGTVNADAVAWARQYTGDLITQINGTTQDLVREAVTSFLETPGATVGDLRARLTRILDGNATRARLIGTTEVTTAFAEGANRGYEAAGIPPAVFKPRAHVGCYCSTAATRLESGEWVVVWRTNQDEKVCTRPIETPWGTVAGCRALEGVIVSEGPWMGQRVEDVSGA